MRKLWHGCLKVLERLLLLRSTSKHDDPTIRKLIFYEYTERDLLTDQQLDHWLRFHERVKELIPRHGQNIVPFYALFQQLEKREVEGRHELESLQQEKFEFFERLNIARGVRSLETDPKKVANLLIPTTNTALRTPNLGPVSLAQPHQHHNHYRSPTSQVLQPATHSPRPEPFISHDAPTPPLAVESLGAVKSTKAALPAPAVTRGAPDHEPQPHQRHKNLQHQQGPQVAAVETDSVSSSLASVTPPRRPPSFNPYAASFPVRVHGLSHMTYAQHTLQNGSSSSSTTKPVVAKLPPEQAELVHQEAALRKRNAQRGRRTTYSETFCAAQIQKIMQSAASAMHRQGPRLGSASLRSPCRGGARPGSAAICAGPLDLLH